eukprot:6035972-Lingulodinium_polyedra.AAC.1
MRQQGAHRSVAASAACRELGRRLLRAPVPRVAEELADLLACGQPGVSEEQCGAQLECPRGVRDAAGGGLGDDTVPSSATCPCCHTGGANREMENGAELRPGSATSTTDPSIRSSIVAFLLQVVLPEVA